jgi:dehydrogenase/reductase SDR family protein 7
LQNNFEVNVLGPIRLTQLLLPRMIQRGKGEFLVVSSVAGKVPAPGQSLYAATKHAVNGYFHTLRSEVNQQGIKITVVCPGPTNTSTLASPNPELTSATRCAELILKAAAHGMREAWICGQPLLVFMYLMQYLPGIGFALIDRVGPKRLKIDRQGSLSSLLFKKGN